MEGAARWILNVPHNVHWRQRFDVMFVGQGKVFKLFFICCVHMMKQLPEII